MARLKTRPMGSLLAHGNPTHTHFVADFGDWKTPYADRRADQVKQELWLHLYSRKPWRMLPSRCDSNARLVLRTSKRDGGEGEVTVVDREVCVGEHTDKHHRTDLRISARGYGRPYLHVLAWWLHEGIALRTFRGVWERFRSSGFQVDHGTRGLGPHVLDWRHLKLITAKANAAQSHVKRKQYAVAGGLKRLTKGGPHLDLKKARRRAKGRRVSTGKVMKAATTAGKARAPRRRTG